MIIHARLCKLPGIRTLFEDNNLVLDTTDTHHGMECNIIDEDLFDFTAQPFVNSDYITADVFDSLPVDIPIDDSIVKKEPEKHTSTLHSNAEKVDYPCDLCSKVFSTKSKQAFHLEIHKGIRKLCPVLACPKTFTTEQGVKSHVKTKHCEWQKSHDKEFKQSVQPQCSLPQGKCVTVQTNKESVHPEPEKDEKSKPVPPKASDSKSNCKENGKKLDQNAKPSSKLTSVKSKKGGQLKHKLDIGVPTESDEEFRSHPLPIPGDEDDDFYDDLVKNI